MTELLEKAIESVRELPVAEQYAIAQIVLDELESERRWEESLANSPEKLRHLADTAWAEHEAGMSEPLDPEKAVKSHISREFRRAFSELPKDIQPLARDAYRVFEVNPAPSKFEVQEASAI